LIFVQIKGVISTTKVIELGGREEGAISWAEEGEVGCIKKKQRESPAAVSLFIGMEQLGLRARLVPHFEEDLTRYVS